ncbi:MAG: hypothetical protein A2173_04650 [Planctomycetes bacterium RBG_13_44_8b]|nr:MAG: hypothetical protein A2173_04650 [Planctomycetes bacterium RBG_13_44_8b]
MASLRSIAIIFLLTVGLLGTIALAKSAGTLLQEGLYAEEVDGNLDAAIKIYQQVITDPSASRSNVAQAMYRQGMCYMKKRDEQQAKGIFQTLVQQYADQTSIVEKVTPLLADLANHDPAALMPPETLAYIELGNPGRQIETILQMLKGTPFENPLAAISGGKGQGSAGNGGRSPADIMAAMFNPSMMAEFKKIRGMAIGITSMQQNNPPCIAVLYPGKSDALRGLILAGLNIVGRASAPTEGMQTLTIQNGPGVAYDDEVIILAQPSEQLNWCVKQYKGIINEPTLASQNKVFAKLSKETRQTNALTVWIDAARSYSAISTMLGQWGQAEQLRMVDGIADVKNIEDIIATFAIEATGIALDAGINFKENHNCLPYKMIQTPNLSRNGFMGIPSEAVAVASFAYGEAGSGSTETAHKALERLTGLSMGREIYSNIEQVNLFIMPSQGASNMGGAIGQIAPCLGLTLTSREPQHTYKLLTQILEIANLFASSKGATQAVERSDAAAGKYVLMLGDMKINFYIGQREKITTLSLSPEVLKASLSAVESKKSVLAAGVLQEPFKQLSADTSKMVLVNVGGAMRIISPMIIGSFQSPNRENLQQALEQLAPAYSRTIIELHTNEQVNNFALHYGITNLPPLDQVFEPVMQISKIMSETKSWGKTEKKEKEAPANIIKTNKAPVIDGAADELWSAARRYKIGNVIYSPLTSADDCSAEFRAMWDENNLYVLVDVTDDKLVNDTSPDQPVTLPTGSTAVPWWFDDCVEVYIDADNSKSNQYGNDDTQYHFDWDKTKPTIGRHNEHGRMENIEFAMKTIEGGYSTEIKFPWSTLGVKPSDGMKIGLDVHVNDDDDGGERDSKIMWWNKEDNAWENPRTFGTARLVSLVGWWKFDETAGDIAADSTGNGYNGKLIGGPKWQLSGGKVGGALELDGVDDYVDTTLAKDLSQWTVAVWVKSPAEPTSETQSGPVHREKNYQINWSHLTDEFRGGAGVCIEESWHAASFGQLRANTWYHLIATYDGENLKAYKNGVLISDNEGASGKPDSEAATLKFGRHATQENFFAGTIDDVRIYSYPLSQEEIDELGAVIATKPQPTDGAIVSSEGPAKLSWKPSIGAVSHKLYLGADKEHFSVDGFAAKRAEVDISALSKAMPAIQKDKTYYWRVDDVHADGKIITGNVWSFTTGGKLVGWWKLDESEGRNVSDSSGNNHSGSIIGNPQWRPTGGKIGGALEFDGDGDYVNLGKGPDFDLTKQITVAVWIKVNRFDKEWQTIIAKGDSALRMQRVRQTDSLEIACSGVAVPGTEWGGVYGKMNVNDGQWHHAAGVYDGKKLSLYIDGKLDVSSNASGNINVNDYPVYIGENAERTGRFWNGLIDDVQIYNYAISEGDILSLVKGK